MSYSRSDYDGDDGKVHCACGATHPPSYRLIGCGQRLCDAKGCHICFQACECSESCGRFCSDHVDEIVLTGMSKPLLACLRCQAEDLDDEDIPANQTDALMRTPSRVGQGPTEGQPVARIINRAPDMEIDHPEAA